MEGVLQIVVSPCAYTFAVHVYTCHSGAANIYYNPRFAMRVHPPVRHIFFRAVKAGNFGFLAFSLELLDRFGPDFYRIIREV